MQKREVGWQCVFIAKLPQMANQSLLLLRHIGRNWDLSQNPIEPLRSIRCKIDMNIWVGLDSLNNRLEIRWIADFHERFYSQLPGDVIFLRHRPQDWKRIQI